MMNRSAVRWAAAALLLPGFAAARAGSFDELVDRVARRDDRTGAILLVHLPEDDPEHGRRKLKIEMTAPDTNTVEVTLWRSRTDAVPFEQHVFPSRPEVLLEFRRHQAYDRKLERMRERMRARQRAKVGEVSQGRLAYGATVAEALAVLGKPRARSSVSHRPGSFLLEYPKWRLQFEDGRLVDMSRTDDGRDAGQPDPDQELQGTGR
jgi:hypothetical protein